MIDQETRKAMDDTLYEVAKMKAEFNLLKQAIINNLELDYSGKELTIRNDKVIIEIMYLIENDEMESLYSFKRQEKKELDAEIEKKLADEKAKKSNKEAK